MWPFKKKKTNEELLNLISWKYQYAVTGDRRILVECDWDNLTIDECHRVKALIPTIIPKTDMKWKDEPWELAENKLGTLKHIADTEDTLPDPEGG